MLLKEALDALQAGARLFREGWDIKDGYLAMMPGMKHVWKIVLQPQPNAGNYIFSLEDLLASDWAHFVSEAEADESSDSEADVEL